MTTCNCGKLTDVLCDACLPRSFTVESAKRRPGLIERLEGDGHGAFERFEFATRVALREAVRTGTLSHTRYDEDDEDWFLLAPATWPRIFDRIETLYLAAALTPEEKPCTTS
jgi:hypothetical protein